MNKITVNHQTEIEKKVLQKEFVIKKNQTLEIKVQNKIQNYHIIVENDVHCNLMILAEQSNITIKLTQGENSHTIVSNFLENSSHNFYANLEGRGATVEYACSILGKESSNHQVHIFHRFSNTKSKIFCNGFSLAKAKILLNVNGYVEKQSKNCSCLQESKIIEEIDSHCQIAPNLYIENYEVEASHSAYIGPFKEQELFYLSSRGIPKRVAIQLLVKSLLLGKLNLAESQKSELIQKIEKQLVFKEN